MAAVDPLLLSGIPEYLAPRMRILGFGQCRSGQAVFRDAGVQFSLVDGQRRNRIAPVGTTAVDPPATSAKPIHSARLIASGFARPGVERATVHGQREDQQRLAG